MNSGHGHVYPRADGVTARCGGPGICSECSKVAAHAWRDASAAIAKRDAEIERLRADANRWKYMRRKLCLTGNGDGTCAMQALNLPSSIRGWPWPMEEVSAFCDAAIDAAINAEKGE